MINRGTVLGRLGRYLDAVEAFDKVLLANPGNASALFNKGRDLLLGGEYT